jgi:hypothetical protein
MLVLDANILMRAVLGKHARELLAKYGRLGDTTNGQRIPRGKPWDRQRISGKRRRKFMSVPGLRRIFTIQLAARA